MTKNLYCFLLTVLLPVTVFSRDIYGYVVDVHDNPLPGAEVCIVSKDRTVTFGRTVTDNVGAFRIGNIPEDTLILIVDAVGFEPKETKLTQNYCPLKIVLLEKTHKLDEVVVTGDPTVLYKNKVSFTPSKKEKRISDGGYNLLYNMPISVLSVDPLSKSIRTNTDDGVELFINGVSATPAEVQNIRSEDVRKIEYLEQPSDPRFNNARYALNYVVVNYDRGGYTKVNGQQRFVTSSGAYSAYSHYEAGRMTYDLLGGYEYSRQLHTGEESSTRYNFTDMVMEKDENKSGRVRNDQGYATFRAKYIADSVMIANSVGMQVNRVPYNNLSGNTLIRLNEGDLADELTFDSHEKEKYYGLEWTGNSFFRLRNGMDLTSDLAASYMDTSRDYIYNNSEGESVVNDIEEDAWELKLNATLRKRFKPLTLGLNIISSISANTLHYKGTTPSDIKVRDWYVIPRLVFDINICKLHVAGNVGMSYEQATYNSQREVYFFPKSYLSGNLNINAKHSLSFSLEYSMYGNSLGMKSPNSIKTDNLTGIKGNPELKNFRFMSPSVSYKIVPGKQTSINLFARLQYFRHPSVYCWEPVVDTSGRTIILRSYTNAGNFSSIRFGASGTLRLLEDRLYLKGTITQYHFRQSGPADVDLWPVSVSGQVTYSLGSFSANAFWEKSSKSASVYEMKKRPQNYFMSLTYGCGNLVVSLSCRNLFNHSWRTSERLYSSVPVNYRVCNWGDQYHQSFVLSASYSFAYGKKTSTRDRIGKSGMPGSAIVE